MKKIDLSTDVYAKLWSLWKPGEETEDDILRRLLAAENFNSSVDTGIETEPPGRETSQRKSSPRKPFEVTRFETANFRLEGTKYDVDAFAIYEDENWTVLAGSKALASWIGSETDSSYEHLHNSLMRNGTLAPVDEDYAEFSKDYLFTSPSAASAVIVGRSDNGRNSWKHVETGQTFNEWISENKEEK